MTDSNDNAKTGPDKSDDFFIKPESVAESAFWLSRQERSAWSFAIEARPFGEPW